jgi:folate-dependent phosphoribosylglycinamide formyltransferase PurN
MNKPSIIILAGKGTSTAILYHSISQHFTIEKVIQEQKESTSLFLKRRIKRYGFFKVFGQLLFQIFCAKPLQYFSKSRRNEILHQYQLKEIAIPIDKLIEVSSVNDPRCMEALQNLNPQIVLVNGTRIISKKTLQCIEANFINIHAGITPAYRGVHGAYWALAMQDAKNCGVTIHTVDAGIDTGKILAQANINITKFDNFTTYPLLQQAQGLLLLSPIINDVYNQKVLPQIENNLASKLWVHPSIWQYFYFRLFKGVK